MYHVICKLRLPNQIWKQHIYLRKMETKKPSKHGHFHESLWPVFPGKLEIHCTSWWCWELSIWKTKNSRSNRKSASCLLSGLPYSIELKSIYTSSCTSLSMISRSKKIHFNLSQPTLGYLEVKGSTFQLHLSKFPCNINIFKILNLETTHMMKFTRKTKKTPSFSCQIQDPRPRNLSEFEDNFQIPSSICEKKHEKTCNPLTSGILQGLSPS